MSKLGFNKVLNRLDHLERNFFTKAMSAAQKEFKQNFDTESNAEDNTKWDSLKRRTPPPPILQWDGNLKAESLKPRNVVIMKGKAILTINPIDKRGRSYAKFHQEGFTHLQAGRIAPRKFVTQSSILTLTQKRILEIETDKCFK